MNLAFLKVATFCPEYPGLWPDNGDKWMAWDWHVLSLAIPGFILCLFFFWLGIKLRNHERGANLTLFLFGLFLALAEIYKQISYNIIRGFLAPDFSSLTGYAWEIFPWQLCSIPMLISLFMPLIKSEKKRNVLIAFMAVFGMMGGFAALFIGQQNLFWWKDIGIYIHTIVWHLVLMMLGFFSIGYLSIGKGTYTRNVRVWAYTYLLFIIFSGVAQFINFIIPNIYGIDSCQAQNTNMWYISMYYNSTVVILKDIWNLSPGPRGFGWIISYILYLLGLGLADYIILSIYYFVYRLFIKLKFVHKVKKLEMSD